MKRKIIQHGSSSLTVSLPYRWANKFRLKKGDEIDVEERGKYLILTMDKQEAESTKRIHIKDNKYFFKRMLINLYRQGYDEIRIDFVDKLPTAAILEKIDELLGYEIVDQQDRYCIIRNVANVRYEEFETVLKRLFMITKSMGEEILKAIETNSTKELHLLARIEKENNKLANYCHRVLNKNGLDTTYETTRFYSIIDRVEVIGDVFEELAEVLMKNRYKPSQKVTNYLKQTNRYFDEVHTTLFAFTTDKIYEIKKLRLKLFSEFTESIDVANDKELAFLHYLRQIAEEIHHIEFLLE